MQLDIGNHIRTLRHRDKKTQEALAEALGVTPQAVSRWESGGSYPDMNLIPSIANYFGISIDELFGYTNQRELKIGNLVTQIFDMKRKNNGVDHNISECISIARGALLEFPGNDKLMLALASVLYTAGYVRYGECHLIDAEGYSKYDTETHKTYAEWREAIPLYEKALQTLPAGRLRERAIEELSQLYLNMGEHEKVMVLAESAPDLWNSREFLRAYACDGKQYVKAHSETLLTTIRACAVFIVNITTGDQRYLTPKEKADGIASAVHLFEVICPDGNFGCHHAYIASLEMLHSLYLWLDEQKDAAFATLDSAADHMHRFITICENGAARYTAPLVRLAVEEPTCNADEARQDCRTMPDDWPWWTVPEAEQVKSEMQMDPRWNAWAAKANIP